MHGTLAQDRYRLLDLLGSGTFAEVWAVLDRRLEVERAVKVLRADVDPSLGAQLSREARVLARISHPAVVHVYDVFTDTVDGAERTCVVMERCDESLGDRVVRDGPIPEAQALAWFDALADGLAKAHGLGVIHRDVKPHNILLVAGEARLADFGLALLGSSVDVVTRTSAVVGTVAFMAEAVRKGEAHTPETDRYGLAASLVYAVTGQLPGDLLRAGNRAGLSERVRARVEAWVGRGHPSAGRSRVGLPAWLLPGTALLVGAGAGLWGTEIAGLESPSGSRGGPAFPACQTLFPMGSRQTYPARADQPRLPEEGTSVATGDFDGDGYIDLAVGFQLGGELRVWWGGPAGPQLADAPTVVPVSLRAGSLRAGDLDGLNQHALLWLPRAEPGVSIGRFSTDRTVTIDELSIPDFPTDLAVLDGDHDGCADVYFLRPSNFHVSIRRSDCDQGWQAQGRLEGRWSALWEDRGVLRGLTLDGEEWRQIARGQPDIAVGHRLLQAEMPSGERVIMESGTPCSLGPGILDLQKTADSVFADFDGDGTSDWAGVDSCGYCTSSVKIRLAQ